MPLPENQDHSHPEERPQLCIPESVADLERMLGEVTDTDTVRKILGDQQSQREICQEMQGVFDLLRRLDTLHRPVEARPRYQEPKIFEDLERKGETLSAWSRLFFVLQWSRTLLHGSDMTFAMARLGEQLLEEGHRIVEIESVQFRKVVATQLKMFASVDEKPSIDEEFIAGGPSVLATFKTSNGRSIHVEAYASGMPIKKEYSRMNPFDHDVAAFMRYRDEDTFLRIKEHSYAFQIEAPSSSHRMDFCWNAHTAQDVVMRAVAMFRNNGLLDHKGPTYAGGFSSFRPPDFRVIGQDGSMHITIRHQDSRITPKGFKLLPMHVDFIDSHRALRGGGIYTHIIPTSKEVSEDHQRRNPYL